MAAAPRPCQPEPAMDEVLISFSRPVSLGESEMRAWIAERSRHLGPSLSLGRADHTRQHTLRVRMHMDGGESAEEQLTDLMLDMRLLGLRPAVVEAPPLGAAD
jgi:hypothetical protein